MALEKFNLWQTFRNEAIIMPAGNKPLAFMAADVNTQALVLLKTISDYSHTLKLNPPQMQSPKR